MNRDEIIGKLLYVPFNDDYRVDDRVRALMTNLIRGRVVFRITVISRV